MLGKNVITIKKIYSLVTKTVRINIYMYIFIRTVLVTKE